MDSFDRVNYCDPSGPWWARSPHEIRPEELDRLERGLHRAIALCDTIAAAVAA